MFASLLETWVKLSVILISSVISYPYWLAFLYFLSGFFIVVNTFGWWKMESLKTFSQLSIAFLGQNIKLPDHNIRPIFKLKLARNVTPSYSFFVRLGILWLLCFNVKCFFPITLLFLYPPNSESLHGIQKCHGVGVVKVDVGMHTICHKRCVITTVVGFKTTSVGGFEV